MDQQGQFIAALLDSAARAHAAGAVSRLAELGDEASGYLESFGFDALVADTELRVRHLAEALAAGRPELFQLDVEWLRSTHAARKLPVGLLRSVLAALRDELTESLPASASGAVRGLLEDALEGLQEACAPLPSYLDPQQPHAELARRFLLALLECRRREAVDMVVEACDSGVSIPELHRHVLGRVQAEVGRMWQVGEAHAAEEHAGTRIIEEVLVVLRRRLPRTPANGRTVIVASSPGNLHDIGARMVADRFELAGWDSIFLGADTPTDALVRAIGDFGADLVAVSSGLGLNVRATAGLVSAIRAAGDVPLIVGGRTFIAIPGLWKDVGADASANDPEEAVRVGESLLAG